MNPLVTIIVLNWNGWQDTLECLESLYQINYPHYQVIVVDNHSQDESLEKIRQYCQGKIRIQSPFFNYQKENKPIKITEITNIETEEKTNNQENNKNRKNIPQKSKISTVSKYTPAKNSSSTKKPPNPILTLIKNDQNYGFAQGNNIAIKYTQKKHNPPYILLLNNDTVVKPDFLTEMIKATGWDSKIGMVSPKLLSAFNPHIIDSTGHVISWGRVIDRGHGEVDQKQYDEQTEVIGAMAAAALYKKEMLLDVGLLDTSYITLGEDADLSWRAHNHGWKAVYAPNAIVYHKRGQSITKKSVIPRMTFLSTQNTAEYVSRYGNSTQKFLYLFVLFKEGLFVLVGSIMGRNEIKTGEYFNMLIRSYLKIFKSF